MLNYIWTILNQGNSPTLTDSFARETSTFNFNKANDNYKAAYNALITASDVGFRYYTIETLIQTGLKSSVARDYKSFDPTNTYSNTFDRVVPNQTVISTTSGYEVFVARNTPNVQWITKNVSATYTASTGKVQLDIAGLPIQESDLAFSGGLSGVIEVAPGLSFTVRGSSASDFVTTIVFTEPPHLDILTVVRNLRNLSRNNLPWVDAELQRIWTDSAANAENKLAAATLNIAMGLVSNG
jgi:hypothetical protein